MQKILLSSQFLHQKVVLTAAQAKQPVRGPGVDARPLPAWGIYARHVETLTVEDARLSLATPDLRPVIFAEKVGRLVLDHARFPRLDGVEQPVATDEVKSLTVVPP